MGTFAIQLYDDMHDQLIWRTNKEKELCAFLVHHSGQVVRSSVILDALWPESNLKKAMSYLYTCISLLRKHLSSVGLQSKIRKVGDGYGIEFADMTSDIGELETNLDRTLRGEELGRPMLDRLQQLYRADYLEDCDYDWALNRREQLANKYKNALVKLFHHFITIQENTHAIECLQSVLKTFPEAEYEGRELMKLYMQQGNRNEAVRVYHQLERSVRARLDLELEDETVQLFHMIHVSDLKSGSPS